LELVAAQADRTRLPRAAVAASARRGRRARSLNALGAAELIAEQRRLAQEAPERWRPGEDAVCVGGCFVCFARGASGPGQAGDRGWAGAALFRPGKEPVTVASAGAAGAAYVQGLLALREGALLEAAVRSLPELPDVLLVNASGRDHPRRAGLALHLGARLDLPTIGVTHRTLLATGEWPLDERGARSPLLLEGELVGYWLRTRAGTRPLAVHAAWRTEPKLAAELVLAQSRARTPEPLRLARQAARRSRAEASA
jgi:deoxyribonuclease V